MPETEDRPERLGEVPDFIIEFARTGANGATGVLTAAVGLLKKPLPFNVEVVGVMISAGTAPTGATILVDVNKNGTTIFTTQANRPSIAISGNTSVLAKPDVTAFAAGDLLSVDVDQIGSGTAGSDLSVMIWCQKR